MNLEQLVFPMPVDKFLSEYWQKKPLYLKHYENFDHVLGLDAINTYLTSSNLIYPFLRIVGQGVELPLEEYLSQGSFFKVLDREKVFQLFEEGRTIVIQGGQYNFPTLGDLKINLTKELNGVINTNIYITPPDSQGFFPHYDTHDVFAMQIFGKKTWRLYDQPCKFPLKGWKLSEEEVKKYIGSKPAHEIELNPGDMLYCPSGVVHDAFCTDELSIHITIGANFRNYLDFLSTTLQQLESSEQFRKPFVVDSHESLSVIIGELETALQAEQKDYNKVEKKIDSNVTDSLFIDYCCIDKIDKLNPEDVSIRKDDYSPENGLEKDIFLSVRSESFLDLFSNVSPVDKIKYQRSFKSLVRKGVLILNH